jgi:iron complex transport system ATP-binding protein
MRISAEGLHFTYPRAQKEALSDACAEVPSGSVLAILGPNGCGKSTLLGALIGTHSPSAGRIRFGDRDLAAEGAKERARLAAFLPQIERLGFGLTALEYSLLGKAPQIAVFGAPSAEDEAAAMRALESAGAADLAGRRVNELSGGELQLVRIARCLTQDTPAIVMDEPTSMLDPRHARIVADRILALSASGRTIIFSTHDTALAAYAADYAVLMSEGCTLYQGSASEALRADRLASCFGVAFGAAPAPSAFSS